MFRYFDPYATGPIRTYEVQVEDEDTFYLLVVD